MSLPGESLDYRISSISPAATPPPLPRAFDESTTVFLARWMYPSLSSSLPLYLSSFLSHHSHRILSISIIGTLHSADPSGPRTNTEYPLARGPILLFSFPLGTKHSSTLGERTAGSRARFSPPPLVREDPRILDFSRAQATLEQDSGETRVRSFACRSRGATSTFRSREYSNRERLLRSRRYRRDTALFSHASLSVFLFFFFFRIPSPCDSLASLLVGARSSCETNRI